MGRSVFLPQQPKFPPYFPTANTNYHHTCIINCGDWIPSVIQAVETSVSLEDIRKGTRWIYDVSKVIPLLIDVERSEWDNGPLAQFPSAVFEKNDMYQILETTNEKTGDG